MRVVLDTNVLFSAISSLTDYHPIWQELQLGSYELCGTTDILNAKFVDITIICDF